MNYSVTIYWTETDHTSITVRAKGQKDAKRTAHKILGWDRKPRRIHAVATPVFVSFDQFRGSL